MRKLLSVLTLAIFVLFHSPTMAADKVVVIPLNITDPNISSENICSDTTILGVTGNIICIPKDCNGVRGGSAYIDSCGCVGGNTGVDLTVTCAISNTGRIWVDRNLGASRVAASSKDNLAYGDLYQWGRLGDGHQNRSSSISNVTVSLNVPGHSNFIGTTTTPHDWRKPQNNNLWQGLGGVNNPCPQGFRLPTNAEFLFELNSWSNQNAAGGFASPLKLVVAGIRTNTGSDLYNVGTYGFYWTSTVDATKARNLVFASGHAVMVGNVRGGGQSVRCIKDLTY